MRKLVLGMAVGALALLVLCAGGGLALYFLLRPPGEIASGVTGTQKARTADGSEIAYPSGYEALDVRDEAALMRDAEKSLREPARSLLVSFSDKVLFAARRGGRLLLVAGDDALLEEVPPSEREAWRADQERLYRQAFAFTAEAIRSAVPEAEVVLDEMTWSEREGALGVLEIRFSYRQGREEATAWMAIVYFPRRIYTVLSVGDEKGFRLLLESSRFAPEREEARASSTPTRKDRPTPTPTARRKTPTPTPAGEGKPGLAFPPGWVVLMGEDVRKLLSSGDVPPEARPYLEIAQQGARAVAYDPTSPGSVIVVLRQPGAMTQEQADLIQQNWESISEALAGSMRAAMESAGWEDVRVEPPELFDHRPARGRAALLAVLYRGDGVYEGARRDFLSAILYFEDEIFVVTAAGVDRETLESVLEGSRW